MKSSNTKQLTQQSETQNTFFSSNTLLTVQGSINSKCSGRTCPMHLSIDLADQAKSKTEGSNFHLILVSALNTAHRIYAKQSLDKNTNKPWSRVFLQKLHIPAKHSNTRHHNDFHFYLISFWLQEYHAVTRFLNMENQTGHEIFPSACSLMLRNFGEKEMGNYSHSSHWQLHLGAGCELVKHQLSSDAVISLNKGKDLRYG